MNWEAIITEVITTVPACIAAIGTVVNSKKIRDVHQSVVASSKLASQQRSFESAKILSKFGQTKHERDKSPHGRREKSSDNSGQN